MITTKKIIVTVIATSCASLLTGCFFAPSMNLTMNKQQLNRTSQIGDVTVVLDPIDQLTPESNVSDYKLGRSDVVSINIWRHPELSTYGVSYNDTYKQIDTTYGTNKSDPSRYETYTIDSQGNIYLPYAGNVKIINQTIAQARSNITKAYKDYIVNPNVNLRVVGFRSQKVFVLGEVMQPQIVPITDIPLNLPMIFGMSGGINSSTANVNQIYVLRKNNKNSIHAYWLDAGSVAAMVYAQSFMLQDNDIIYVSTNGLAQFNRVMTQLLPTAETIWYAKSSVPAALVPALAN